MFWFFKEVGSSCFDVKNWSSHRETIDGIVDICKNEIMVGLIIIDAIFP